jgi:RNA polymerase-binding transcription factor DksA
MQLRESLGERRSLLSKDALEQQPAFSTHMADAGTDTYDRDMALSVLSAEQDAAYELDEALSRIRNGTYGVCELTGKRIGARRLEAIPWTRFSAEVERQLESDGQVGRARLGPRESVERTTGQEQEEE